MTALSIVYPVQLLMIALAVGTGVGVNTVMAAKLGSGSEKEAGFSDRAVTALGLYYKWQTFFFIPLGAMQTCIVPVVSFNYAARDMERCKKNAGRGHCLRPGADGSGHALL